MGIGAEQYGEQRAAHILKALRLGTLDPAHVGGYDRHLIAGMPQVHSLLQLKKDTGETLPSPAVSTAGPGGGGGFLGIPGTDILENLGSDVWTMTSQLPQSVVTTGKALGSDIYENVIHPLRQAAPAIGAGAASLIPGIGLTPAGQAAGAVLGNLVAEKQGLPHQRYPETEKKIIKPTREQYAWLYGPALHGDVGETLHRAKEHPLFPLLDVATVASLGAGGAARTGGMLARVTEPESVLGRVARGMRDIQSTEGRPIIPGSEGLGERGLGIERDYSRRPLVKYGIQKPLDKLVQGRTGQRELPSIVQRMGTLGQPRTLAELAINRHESGFIRNILGVKNIRAAEQVHNSLRKYGIIDKFKALNPKERVATYLAGQGIGFQRLPSAGEYGGLYRSNTLLEEAATYWQRSLENRNPTGENFKDFEHLGVPREYVQELAHAARDPEIQQLIRYPTPAMRDAHEAWSNFVRDETDTLNITPQEHFERIWAPSQELRRNAIKDPAGSFERYADESVREMGEEARPLTPTYYPHELARGKIKTDLQGGHFVPHRRRRRMSEARATAENVLSTPRQKYLEQADMTALKAGVMSTDPQRLVEHVARVSRDFGEKWFNEQALNRIAYRNPDTGDLVRYESRDALNGANGPPGGSEEWVRVPENLPMHFFNKEVDNLQEVLNVVAEKAPRTSEGTPIISPEVKKAIENLEDENARVFVQEHLSAMRPAMPAIRKDTLDYIIKSVSATEDVSAFRHLMNRWRTLLLAYMPRWWITTAVGNFFLAFLQQGLKLPINLAKAQRLMREDRIPEGVRLGGFYGAEGELGAGGAATGRALTKGIYHSVQKVEDYFRSAGFVHELSKEAKYAMRESASVLDDYGARGIADEAIDDLLEHPKFVERAMTNNDKFFYNYTALGPAERRFIRTLVPFWGWYKFATKLVWRLPVEYPGRTLVMAHLGQVAKDTTEQEIGLLPAWIQGAIILNSDPKNFKYLPTFGLNPLANYANPYQGETGEGGALGLLRLGQLNPLVQAGLAGAGIDTLTGGQMGISPESGVVQDPITGEPFDVNTGAPTTISNHEWAARILGSLGRSIPQLRIAEQVATQGQPVYPESIPLIREVPIGTDTSRGVGAFDLIKQTTGLQERPYDLESYQKFVKEQAKASKSRYKSDVKKRKKALSQ